MPLNDAMPCFLRKLAICHMRCSPRPPSVFVQYEKITDGKEVCSAKGVLGGSMAEV